MPQLYAVYMNLNSNIMIGKLKGWKNTYYANIHQKKVGVPILTSNKVDSRAR